MFIKKISTVAILADLLTKGLPPNIFREHVASMSLVDNLFYSKDFFNKTRVLWSFYIMVFGQRIQFVTFNFYARSMFMKNTYVRIPWTILFATIYDMLWCSWLYTNISVKLNNYTWIVIEGQFHICTWVSGMALSASNTSHGMVHPLSRGNFFFLNSRVVSKNINLENYFNYLRIQK